LPGWSFLPGDERGAPPSCRQRALAAFLVGLAAGAFAWLAMRRPDAAPDFIYPWTAARALLRGANPYDALPGGGPDPFRAPLLYPFPTVLATVPVAWLPMPVAGALLVSLMSAALAFGVTRDHLWRLHLFATPSFVMAASLGQWSPLVMLAALYPAAGLLATLKPNIGAAVLVARPTRLGLLSACAAVALSVVVLPSWPLDWFRALQQLRGHPAPIASPFGLPLALALLRWRRADARFLLAMSCVPQLLFFADQLPLWLLPRTRRESLALAASSQVAFAMWLLLLQRGDRYVPAAEPWVLLLIYLPALVLILRRPNERGPRTAVLAA
jgi:hypothetical protein